MRRASSQMLTSARPHGEYARLLRELQDLRAECNRLEARVQGYARQLRDADRLLFTERMEKKARS